MRILCIGNSFSQNATRYLYRLADSAGSEIMTANLYIGGCSLRTHYLNMLENILAYTYQFNGINTGLCVTIKHALLSFNWDYITLQQVSSSAPYYSTFQPYLNELAAYIRKYQPHAKLLMHQTWAYEEGSPSLIRGLKFATSADMLASIREAYEKAAKDIGAVGIIPSGEAMLRAVENGIPRVHDDGKHASLGIGCYLLALTWYGTLTGKSVKDVPFDRFTHPVSAEEQEIAKRTVDEILGHC